MILLKNPILIAVFCLMIFAMTDAASADTYWRIASYPTWTGSLQQYHYDTFNMFFHFNMEPQSDGGLSYGGIESAENARNEIAKAHAQNDLMVLVIGGDGYGTQFQGATSNANRAKFVNEITNRVSTLGYDGITMDWEEGVNNADLVKTMKELRTEFNKLNPVPLLLIDVCCEVTTDSIKQIEPYVDSINTMDYETSVGTYFNELRNAGIPASKIINGLGFYAYVNSEARARSEAQFVIDNGMKGIEVWDTGEVNGSNDLRTKAIRELLGTGPSDNLPITPKSYNRLTVEAKDGSGNKITNATIEIYDLNNTLLLRVNSTTSTDSKDLESDGSYSIKYVIPSGDALVINNLTLTKNITLSPQIFNNYTDYTGLLPAHTEPRSAVIALNDSDILGYGAEITLKLNSSEVNRILHCTTWTYSGASCSNWESKLTSDYNAYSDGSTIRFNVTSFDAYLAGYAPATCSDGIQNQEGTGMDCGGPCSACYTPPSNPPPSGGGGAPTQTPSKNSTKNISLNAPEIQKINGVPKTENHTCQNNETAPQNITPGNNTYPSDELTADKRPPPTGLPVSSISGIAAKIQAFILKILGLLGFA